MHISKHYAPPGETCPAQLEPAGEPALLEEGQNSAA